MTRLPQTIEDTATPEIRSRFDDPPNDAIWQIRIHGESSSAFLAFQDYLDLPRGKRTLAALSNRYTNKKETANFKAPSEKTIASWSKKYSWAERKRAFEDWESLQLAKHRSRTRREQFLQDSENNRKQLEQVSATMISSSIRGLKIYNRVLKQVEVNLDNDPDYLNVHQAKAIADASVKMFEMGRSGMLEASGLTLLLDRLQEEINKFVDDISEEEVGY